MIADLWENRVHYFATLEAIFDGDDEEHEKVYTFVSEYSSCLVKLWGREQQ